MISIPIYKSICSKITSIDFTNKEYLNFIIKSLECNSQG